MPDVIKLVVPTGQGEQILPLIVIPAEPAPELTIEDRARGILIAQVMALWSYGLDTDEIAFELRKLDMWIRLKEEHVYNALGWWRQSKGRAP